MYDTFNLTKVIFVNIEGAGLMTCTAAPEGDWGVLVLIREAVILSNFLLIVYALFAKYDASRLSVISILCDLFFFKYTFIYLFIFSLLLVFFFLPSTLQ